MKTEKLIDILSEEGDAVKHLMNPYLRFAVWITLSLVPILFAILVIDLLFGNGFNFKQDFTGFILLLSSILLPGFLAFALNSPVMLKPQVKILFGGIFFIWILRTFTGIFLTEGFTMDSIWQLYSGKPHTGCTANTYLFFAIPFFIFIIMLRSGYTLEKTWTGFYALTACLSTAELITAVLCPHSEHLHVLEWHILPVIPITAGIWLLSERLLQR